MTEELQKVKFFELKDLDTTLKFKLKLMNAEQGINFLDKIQQCFRQNDTLSIKPYLNDLLQLAIPLQQDGITPIFGDKLFSLDLAYTMIQNPLSIVELALEVLKHQEVFMKGSEIFQTLMNKVKDTFNTKI